MEEDVQILTKIVTEAFEDDDTWSKLPKGYAFIAIKDEDLMEEAEVVCFSKENFNELLKEDFKFEHEREDRIPVISWI
jgi:hypothetical protein